MSEIKVGDRVTWMKKSKRGKTISFSTRQGTVQAIENGVAVVKPPSPRSHRVKVHVERLRRDGETTELTELVTAAFESARGKQ